jgi:hypothetical protein
MEFPDLVGAIHNKTKGCYGWSFLPCRLALKEITQNYGGNIFTQSFGTVNPDAGSMGATSKMLYYRNNVHLNNRLSTAKGVCLEDLVCEDCDGTVPIAYVKLGLYLSSAGSVTMSPSGEELMSAWITQGANNDQSLNNFDTILEEKNGTVVLTENQKLNLYGTNDTLGNIGISVIRKDTLDNGVESTATYYSMILALDPADPQLTLDIMLTYTWDTVGGDKWSNHPDPTKLKVEGMLYLEGFYT